MERAGLYLELEGLKSALDISKDCWTEEITDLCLSYRIEGKLDPLKDNLGNHVGNANANATIIALHSDLGWVMVAVCFLQSQSFSFH